MNREKLPLIFLIISIILIIGSGFFVLTYFDINTVAILIRFENREQFEKAKAFEPYLKTIAVSLASVAIVIAWITSKPRLENDECLC